MSGGRALWLKGESVVIVIGKVVIAGGRVVIAGGRVVIAGGRVAIARGRALHLPEEVWLKPKGERYEREEGESVVIVTRGNGYTKEGVVTGGGRVVRARRHTRN